jgi:hypothetical protein
MERSGEDNAKNVPTAKIRNGFYVSLGLTASLLI